MTKVKKLAAILAACLMSFSMVGGLSANAAFNAETSNNFQSNEGVTTNMTYLYTTTISSNNKTYATYGARYSQYSRRYKSLICESYYVYDNGNVVEKASSYKSGNNQQYDSFINVSSANNLLVVGGIGYTTVSQTGIQQFSVELIRKTTADDFLSDYYYSDYL